jgi:hypothetical protein
MQATVWRKIWNDKKRERAAELLKEGQAAAVCQEPENKRRNEPNSERNTPFWIALLEDASTIGSTHHTRGPGGMLLGMYSTCKMERAAESGNVGSANTVLTRLPCAVCKKLVV